MATDRLVGSTIPSLVGGVSQQPATVRLPNQFDEQINILSRIDKGAARRPPSEFVDQLINAAPPTGGYHVHIYERDGSEKYIVLLANNAKPRVFDFTGTEATVNEPDGHSYMNFDTAAYTAGEAFAAVTVADTTFIVNRTIAPAMSGTPTADRPNEFLIFSQADGTTSHTINVIIDGVANSSGPQNTPAAMISALDTNLNGAFTDWDFTQVREGAGGDKTSVIYGVQVANLTPEDLVEVSDSLGNRFHKFIYKSIQNFSDLPPFAPDGFTVEVVGSQGDGGESYWVAYDAEENTWRETVAPGIDNDFDLDTMPYRLVRDSVSPLEFTFERVPWASRTKGDEISAAEPSFIGHPIKDLAVHKNRLVFLAAEDVAASEAGDFFNFWPTTVTTVVDSDPIDKTASTNRVAFLDWCVPFDGKLLMVSGRGALQAELLSEELQLTPGKTVAIERSAYDSSEAVRPLVLGQVAYLAVDRDTTSGILEYRSPQEVNGTAKVEENTAHIPEYLPNGITLLDGSTTENTMVAYSPEEPNTLFVYRYYYLNRELVMNSWSRWDLAPNATILGFKFIRSTLWIVLHVPNDGINLEKIDLRKLEDGDLGWRACIDSQVEVTGVHSAGVTTFTLPYDPLEAGGTYLIVKSDADWDDALGQLITAASTTNTGLTATGNHSAHPVRIGRIFESELTLSPIVINPGASSRSVATPQTLGRLEVQGMTFQYVDTGAFTVTVDRREVDEDVGVWEFAGREVGGPQLIGPVTLNDGEFQINGLGEARHTRVTISSSAITPFTLTAIDWWGYYVSQHVAV